MLGHHKDSGLGSMSKPISSPMKSLIITVKNYPVVTEDPIVVSPHHAAEIVLIVVLTTKPEAPTSRLPFLLNSPKDVLGNLRSQHRSLHTTFPDASGEAKLRLAVLKARSRPPPHGHASPKMSRHSMAPWLRHVKRPNIWTCHEGGHLTARPWRRVPSVLLPLPVFLQNVRDQDMHVLTIHASLGSHMELSPLFWVTFLQQHSGHRTEQYHFTFADISAIARNPRIPFSNLESGFFWKISRKTFHASGARYSPGKRLSNQWVTSYTVSLSNS